MLTSKPSLLSFVDILHTFAHDRPEITLNMENRDNTLDTLDNLIPKSKHLAASLTNKSKTENTITIVEMGSAWDTA